MIGGSVIESEGNFVEPTIVEISPNANVVKEELFAPVLYVMKFKVSSCVDGFLRTSIHKFEKFSVNIYFLLPITNFSCCSELFA